MEVTGNDRERFSSLIMSPGFYHFSRMRPLWRAKNGTFTKVWKLMTILQC